MKAAQGQLWVR